MLKPKLIRITTVPQSLRGLLRGQLRFMSDNGFNVIGISSPGEALKEVELNERIRVEEISMTRTISIFNDIKSLYDLYVFFRREKPLIVHTHTPKAGALGMMAAKIAGIPHRFHTVAGLPLLETKGIKRKILDKVEKITYSCATNIFVNSIGLQAIIIENRYTNSVKLQVLANGSSNGINTEYFDPSKYSDAERAKLRENLGIDAQAFVFIFVGRLVADKGINELVSAFSSILKLKKSVKLLLVGPFEDNLDPLLPETLQKINDNSNILLVGYQPDVRPFFAIADCLVFPSYREGFPNVVMQAGAMGLPSIVTNINGCNEIINNGQNGLVIPVKDSEAVKKSMEFMLSENALFKQMKEKSRTMIVNRYEQKLVWDAILREYTKILNNV